MKKYSPILMALLLAACGGSESYNDPGTQAAMPAPTPAPPAADAFLASVESVVATMPDDAEGASVDAIVATAPEDAEPKSL